jgi:metal-dependent amidase/aminoacylase/carboxypeptidase family protein
VKSIDEMFPRLVETRRDIHRHPERVELGGGV